ncbi:MAG: hypothetical protein AAF390_19335 [Pseudomonadota bacterium]
MNRFLIALGVALIVLPFVVMAIILRVLPEEGLATMADADFYQTRTYTYAVAAVVVMVTGLVCTIVGALSLAAECHRDNIRQYCGGREGEG